MTTASLASSAPAAAAALPPSADTQARVASDAAAAFVDAYYETRNRRQFSSLAAFYAGAGAGAGGGGEGGGDADIVVNGRALPNLAAYEAALEVQGHPVHCDVTSFDAQPVCANYLLRCPEALGGAPAGGMAVEQQQNGPSSAARGRGSRHERDIEKSVRDGERISFAVQVSGIIRYGRASEDGFDERSFNEAWLLVPNWEALGPKAPRGARKWLVVSQNFRAL
ncbi:nuclear transport factor 2 domain-containing protein [Xylariaceae sp. FL0804]|nr:nuclear transport factor 2 domain-containing protein [Xylariaceae sp. FL0804]